jgi:peptidoglycan/xylan/chitin deacetylase (PgdA/CDA1 family)
VRNAIAACLLLLVVPAYAQKVAITFDDLPLNGSLPPGVTQVSIAKDAAAILREHRVPPVFGFLNAGKLDGNADGAEALRVWVAAGQRVGNHAYSHMDLHRNSASAFAEDVARNEPTLQLLSPKNDWHWLRYPFLREGDTLDKRREVRAYLRTHDYTIAQVTLDYEDYLWNTPYARCVEKNDKAAIEWLRSSYLHTAKHYIDVDRELSRIVFERDIDHVLLLHLGAFTRTILPDVLALLKSEGLTLATLEEVTRDPAYREDPDAASRYGGTLLEQLMDARKLSYPQVEKKPTAELDKVCR